MNNKLIFILLNDQVKNFIGGAGTGIIVLIVFSVILLIVNLIGKIVAPQTPQMAPPKPKTPIVPRKVSNLHITADTSFTVIQRKKNQEYVLSHIVYGNQIHMNSDDLYNPGDTFELDMTDYKIAEIEIQRSPDKITKEKWLLPR